MYSTDALSKRAYRNQHHNTHRPAHHKQTNQWNASEVPRKCVWYCTSCACLWAAAEEFDRTAILINRGCRLLRSSLFYDTIFHSVPHILQRRGKYALNALWFLLRIEACTLKIRQRAKHIHMINLFSSWWNMSALRSALLRYPAALSPYTVEGSVIGN